MSRSSFERTYNEYLDEYPRGINEPRDAYNFEHFGLFPDESMTLKVGNENPTSAIIRLGAQALPSSALMVVDLESDMMSKERRRFNNVVGSDADMAIVQPHVFFDRNNDQASVRLDPGDTYNFGRNINDTVIKLGDPGVSRVHLSIGRDTSIGNVRRFKVADLGSRLGTYIIRPARDETGGVDQDENSDYESADAASKEKPNQTTTNGEFMRIVESDGASRASDRHPGDNQDAYFVDDLHKTYAVADGVGSGDSPGLAARIAVDYLQKHSIDLDKMTNDKGAPRAIVDFLHTLNEFVVAQTSADYSDNPSSATATLAKVHKDPDGKEYVTLGWLGDCRGYLARNGKLFPLTVDHNIYSETHDRASALAMQKRLSAVKVASDLAVSGELNDMYNNRNLITRSIGDNHIPESKKDSQISVVTYEVRKGDILVLTSDGIHDNLTDEEIGKIINSAGDKKGAKRLLESALARSRSSHIRSKKDDMTATVTYL